MNQKIIFIILAMFGGVAIAGINLLMIFPWFMGNGPANLGSIEVSYVSMGRFISDFFPNLSFAPYWYFGFPFHVFYTPLLPVLEVIVNKLGGFSLWQSYRIVSGLGIVLAPVSLFFFTWGLTRKFVCGILAAFLYTFLPSLFYYILPSGEVAADTFNQGLFDPRRLVILARWGEGPHTLSLIFIPLAGLFFLRFLELRRKREMILTALFVALTALTNAVGFYALLFLILAIFFASFVKKSQTFGTLLGLSVFALLLSYGFIAFWYNVSFMGTFFGESGGVLQNYLNMLPWGLILLVGIIAFLYFFFRKIVRDKALIISLFWFLLMFGIVYIYYTSAPPELSEQRLEFAPQALRLMTEVDMALAVLLASLLAGVTALLEKRLKMVGKMIGLGLGVLGVVGVLGYGLVYLPYGQKAVSGEVNLGLTGEKRMADWLSINIDQKKGERVYAAGNYAFYLNYFTDIWQLRGGLYQAKTHPWPEHIYYQESHGQNASIALDWLKIANIKYLVLNTSSSQELYKDYEYPGKFASLEEVYNDRGDIIYQLPLKGTGPAKIVSLSALAHLKTPKKADSKEPLAAYAGWLEEARPASFEVLNNDLYKIKGDLEKGEGILVQMTYDKGFKARSENEGVRITKDPLGFMILTPEKDGDFEITLSHGKTWDVWLGYLVSLGTLVLLIIILGRKFFRKKTD